MTDDEKAICRKAVVVYGEEEQCRMAMEECAELIQAINKHLRKDTAGTFDNVVEEIADVQIMIRQLQIIFGITDEKISKVRRDKLARLDGRLKSHLRKAIAIDFDGCLCENAYPNIGKPNIEAVRAALAERQKGTALILWTCRTGRLLGEALEACEKWGLTFDAVNENLPERIAAYGSDPRKIGADEYWDDKSVWKGSKNAEKKQVRKEPF